MSRIFTSYFYQVRNLHPTQVPVSTAIWDPKWFHDFKGKDHIFIDKNGVVNGFRAEFFAPDDSCSHLCRGAKNCSFTHDNCLFLKNYRLELAAVDPRMALNHLSGIAAKVRRVLHLMEDPDIILMVYETPSNPCSERIPLQEWFRLYGLEVPELTE
ncbi:MAG: hypothetical protein NC548_35355 [Lachnospiraceae bacterium]|nr:hypothetical protein [Lachnospiraceae bacterium]